VLGAAAMGLATAWRFGFSFRETFGFKLAGARFCVIGALAPLAYQSLAYGSAVLLGFLSMDWGHAFSGKALAVAFLLRLLRVTGAELGWRGFLFPVLRKVASFRAACLVSGLIWSVWHFPAILFGNYNNGGTAWYVLVNFTVMVTGMTFLMSWLREKSGSVLPAILVHLFHNFFLQQILDPMVVEGRCTKVVGSEWGIALALALSLVMAVFWRYQGEDNLESEQGQS
jgi:membrane protease YdiL (CAAX protease family)